MNNNTIYDIAKACNVSPATVSRVFAGRGSKKNRSLVLKMAEEMNFTPNDAAKVMRTKKTNRILLAIPDICNTFYFKLIEGANSTLEKHGYLFILYYTKHSLAEELKAIQLVRQKIVDGMIMVSFNFCEENIKEICNCGSPVVLTNKYEPLETESNIDYVYVDTYEGIKLATKHLINQGHKNIAYVGGNLDEQTGKERFLGYHDCMIEAGLSFERGNVFDADYSEKGGYLAGKKIVASSRKFTGIVAANDLIAMGALTACEESNIRIPQDMALIGMDNTALSSKIQPKLTTVAMREDEIGQYAAARLIELLENQNYEEKQRIKLIPELLIRQSSIGTTL